MPSNDETGESLARAARTSLPVVAGVDLGELAQSYAAAVPRVLGEVRWRFFVADLAAVILLVYLSRAAVRLIQSAPASSPSWAVFVAASAYGLVIIAGAALACTSATAVRASPHAVDLTAGNAGSRLLTLARTRPLHGLLGMTVVITGLITPVDELEALWFGRGFDAFRRGAELSSGYVTLAAILALGELCWLFFRFGAQEKRVSRPRSLDQVATRLVVVAAAVRCCAERAHEVSDQEVRSLVRALEKAAREAERFPLLSVPWRDRATRREAGVDGARLAQVIRTHKAPLMRAISSDDFAGVARSLTGGLAAWAVGDFAAMLRDAPEVVEASGPGPWLDRLGPAFVLAVLGIVLPMLPPLNEVTQAAAAARTSLLAGALMAIVSGSVKAPEYVQKVLEKTVNK